MATESTGYEAPLQGDVKESEDATNGPIEKPNNEDDEAEFVWEEYLEESNSVAAPPTAFIHVEQSIQSCFTEGMKLEVPNKHISDSYWIASVIMTCGPLLRLRFEGYDDDRSADFWCDITTSEVHPIGWCAQNKKTLAPPPELEDKHADWSLALVQALTGANTVPSYLLEANGTTPADLIKQGMKIEVQEKLNPSCVWLATILENVGGRLLLRYEGSGSTDDFWLFYLSYRLHPVGWATQNQCKYKPPDGMTSLHNQDKWAEILRQAMEEASKFPIPHDIFKNQEKLENHQFKEGMKLEAVNPSTLMQFCPATVSKVIDSVFFLVQIDDHSVVDHQPLVMCCHAKSPFIFPVGWAKANGLKIMHPKGWLNYRQEFEWSDYLTYCKAEAAPSHLLNLDKYEHGFEKGMKLEAVNPFQPHQLCAATITKIVHHLLWIQLDSIDSFHPNHIVPVNSHDIFPVGWCESNGYPLKPPLNCQQRKACLMKKVAIVIPEKQYMDKKKKPEKVEKSGSDAKAWCPKIFFNHRCFSGPYLSKGRIAELPRDVGPGPVTLVLREVLSMLINVAYKSSRVLRELQLQTKPNPSMHQCVLKAKYKGKCHRAMVEVVRNSEKVAEFCRSICVKLECCPYLFGPEYVGDNCPDQCSKLTKTKYTYYGKRKKKIGRPPIVETETETVNKIGNKRGRKRKIIDQEGKENGGTISNTNNKVENEEEKSVVTDEIDCKPQDDDSKDDQALKQKRKYVKYIPPKSDIVTRGAKIPNFALELNRRRHRKHRVTGSPVSTSSSNSRASSEDGSKETFDSSFLDPEPQLIPKEEEKISNEFQLQTNPLHWSVDEVIHFIKGTDCAQFARLFRDQDIDGQALLLLTLPTVQEHLDLKLGPAIKLCHQIEKIKFAFYNQFAK